VNTLFGISTTTLAIVLVVVLACTLLISGYIAVRNPVIFRLGVRNVPRRKAQTALIVIGLMLSTLIMAAAFTTGDTISYSISDVVYRALGRVDEVVQVKSAAGGLSTGRVPESVLTDLEARFAGDPDIAGFVPAVQEPVPLFDARTQQAEAIGILAGVDAARIGVIGGVDGIDGKSLDIASLGANEAYLNATGADKLNARVGDSVTIFYGNAPMMFTVRAIVRDGVLNGSSGQSGTAFPGLLVPLDRARAIINKPGYGAIYVANTGTARTGIVHSDAAAAKLLSVVEAQNLGVTKIKQDNVRLAETAGNLFTTFFVVLGLFTIAAGILLIFLIFTMLAAERRGEMGMARAIGMQRRHLVQMFIAEGTAYDLLAAAVGAALGVLTALGMVSILKRLVGDQFPIVANVQPRSIVIAYCLGVVLTFGTVAFSSFRVSRLNIVAAIRDVDEAPRRQAARRTLLTGIAFLIVGTGFFAWGLSTLQRPHFNIGVMLYVFGLAFVLRFIGVPERGVFTGVGVFLIAWWCVPFDTQDRLWGKMTGGIEMFFFAGVALVAGAVLLILYNADLLLAVVAWAGQPFGKYAPALRTGIAYPLANRSRTGLTLAMFGLIIFALVVMSTTNANFAAAFTNPNTLGGWDLAVQTNSVNPIADFSGAVQTAGTVNTGAWSAVSTSHIVYAPNTALRLNGAGDAKQFNVRSVDAPFLDHNSYTFQARAPGYATNRAIWDALKRDSTLAVIDAAALPRMGAGANFGGDQRFTLTGIKADTKTLPALSVEVRDPLSNKMQTVTIIGVIDNAMNISDGRTIAANGLYLPEQTYAAVFAGNRQQFTTTLIATQPGTNVKEQAYGIKAALVRNGAQALNLKDELQKAQAQSQGFVYLLQGFLGLGLVVGIAALGVISFRAVVERRQQIGMLRALGYQRGMVSASFLIESLFIAITGAVIGITTGLVLARNLLTGAGTSTTLSGTVIVPVGQIALFTGIAVVAAYIMTVLPARQASRVPIAEALRYE